MADMRYGSDLRFAVWSGLLTWSSSMLDTSNVKRAHGIVVTVLKIHLQCSLVCNCSKWILRNWWAKIPPPHFPTCDVQF